MNYCENCGKKTSITNTFCEDCGERHYEHNFCEECGADIMPNEEYCIECGTGVNPISELQSNIENDGVGVIPNLTSKTTPNRTIEEENIEELQTEVPKGRRSKVRASLITVISISVVILGALAYFYFSGENSGDNLPVEKVVETTPKATPTEKTKKMKYSDSDYLKLYDKIFIKNDKKHYYYCFVDLDKDAIKELVLIWYYTETDYIGEGNYDIAEIYTLRDKKVEYLDKIEGYVFDTSINLCKDDKLYLAKESAESGSLKRVILKNNKVDYEVVVPQYTGTGDGYYEKIQNYLEKKGIVQMELMQGTNYVESTSTPEPIESINKEAAEENKFPVFDDVTASGYVEKTEKGDYYPKNMIDGDRDTAWQCNGTSNMWVALLSDNEQVVNGINILSGYTKYYSEYYGYDLYYMNNRPKDITISFSDGTSIEKRLSDEYGGVEELYQDIRFDSPKYTRYIRIEINSVYHGSKWTDTAISEIKIY